MDRPRSAVHSRCRLLGILLAALACAACGATATSTTTTHRANPQPKPAASSSTTTSSPTTSSSTSAALPGTGEPPVTLGDKNYTEQFVLGQLYLQALTAQGFTVNLNQNIGPTQVTVQAMAAGSLSMYPEYLDLFDSVIAGYRHGFRSSVAAYSAAERYAVDHGLALLTPTPFSDTDAIAVTDAYATAHRLRSIGDLRRVSDSLTIGGPPQFQKQTPGLPSLARSYDLDPAGFQALAIGDQYGALDTGAIEAADVNTTDGELATGDYAVLSDPHHVFGWGNVVPVVAEKVLAVEGPAFVATIERVDGDLTTDVMRRLNEAVDVAGEDPATVARVFLETHGLLSPLP